MDYPAAYGDNFTDTVYTYDAAQKARTWMGRAYRYHQPYRRFDRTGELPAVVQPTAL